ncbi:DUF6172 family protein [Hydrogenophaga electricum]|uniref:Uncharacterized protein n=1 Tax=Hydrogenophaga electricum TaxID=1230953 RepID=A0ABQ6CB38_9BURK|nr:DUF6172 family protein [Hydrogenophaga electricum]GLS15471.1 hypothetical protein GCM10007935_29070 [Hydrogenophaga electricum]
MRKTYPLQAQGKKHPDRVLDAVKHDIRRYFRRERGRPLPEGVDFWDFDCKVGATADSAETVQVSEVIATVDALAQTGIDAVYVEILGKHGVRTPRPPKTDTPAESPSQD